MEADRAVFTLREAAEYLQVHVNTMRAYAKTGKVPSFRVGRLYRFRKDALDSLGGPLDGERE